jgi:alpha-ketoglutarate-dependent 2,4-dichlorophenoxyacetate dioxygenase
MRFRVRPLHPVFCAEISGIDIGRPLDAVAVRAISDAVDRYAVLVLPNQDLDDERQLAFAGNFGEIEAPRSARPGTKRRLRPEISDISNLDENHRLRMADDPRRFDQLGNRLWHTDGSFRRIPAALSMLYAHQVTTSGGETEFADLRTAWDALPDKTKTEIEGLVAIHDIAYSRSQIGFTELLFGERDVLPPVPQRLVRVHPGSRRKTLYLAAHASQ